MRTFGFDDERRQGQQGEEEFLRHQEEQALSYERYPTEQQRGIDALAGDARIDIKTQSYKYIFTGNLPLEIFSAVEASKVGWFLDSATDIVVWLYESEDGGYWNTAIKMTMSDDLRTFITEHADLWKRTESRNENRYGTYHSVCYMVPVPAFPPGSLELFDIREPQQW